MRLPALKIRYSESDSLSLTMVLMDATWSQKVDKSFKVLGGVKWETFKKVSSLPVSKMKPCDWTLGGKGRARADKISRPCRESLKLKCWLSYSISGVFQLLTTVSTSA